VATILETSFLLEIGDFSQELRLLRVIHVRTTLVITGFLILGKMAGEEVWMCS
jgi:hypothetical protein